jgi:hypothetical protein
MASLAHLREALGEIVEHVLPCTDEEARTFFHRFPLEDVFR